MARTGRPRKPTVLKLLAGNPGKRKVNRKEPKIAAGKIPIPAHLGAVARAEWRRLEKLLPRGLVTPADRGTFAQYCQTWARVVEAAVIGLDPSVERVDVAGVDEPVVQALGGEGRLRVGVDRDGARFERHRSRLRRLAART